MGASLTVPCDQPSTGAHPQMSTPSPRPCPVRALDLPAGRAGPPKPPVGANCRFFQGDSGPARRQVQKSSGRPASAGDGCVALTCERDAAPCLAPPSLGQCVPSLHNWKVPELLSPAPRPLEGAHRSQAPHGRAGPGPALEGAERPRHEDAHALGGALRGFSPGLWGPMGLCGPAPSRLVGAGVPAWRSALWS